MEIVEGIEENSKPNWKQYLPAVGMFQLIVDYHNGKPLITDKVTDRGVIRHEYCRGGFYTLYWILSLVGISLAKKGIEALVDKL